MWKESNQEIQGPEYNWRQHHKELKKAEVTGAPGKTPAEFSISNLEVLHSCKGMKLFCVV